jgi:hypothetical protein
VAIDLSGPDENRPLDVVVMTARRTRILRLVRFTEYPRRSLVSAVTGLVAARPGSAMPGALGMEMAVG